MPNKTVYFNNYNLGDLYDMFITNAGVYSIPDNNYESIPIAGRNGNLLFDKTNFDNVEHKYPCIITGNFDDNFLHLKSALMLSEGYQILRDDFMPDEFYLAYFKRFENIHQPSLNPTKGSFTLVFERKPQRFADSGEEITEFTSSGTLVHPFLSASSTRYPALPRMRVYGSGTLTINDISIEIDTDHAFLDIDCDLQEVLQDGGNLDVTLTDGAFPYLVGGSNGIVLGSGITKVMIKPRWWYL